jgi:hypothetical protein
MNEELDCPREDIAFLRSLVGDGTGTKRDAAMLLAVGLVFGSLNFIYWLIFAGRVDWPVSTKNWLWVAGLAVFAASLVAVHRTPRPRSAAGRAAGTALAGVGLALMVAELAFFVGGKALHVPLLALWSLPVVLFTLYGAAWSVAFVVKRRIWFGIVAVGCYVTAVVCGFAMSSSTEWLASSLGLFALVAAPGAVMLLEAHE